MNFNHAENYAKEWIQNWNNRDLKAVLSHYADDIVFRSPKAEAILGIPEVRGKDELTNYWTQSLARNNVLFFRLKRFVWDQPQNELIIFYESRSPLGVVHACETMKFNEEDKVIEGTAYYSSKFVDQAK